MLILLRSQRWHHCHLSDFLLILNGNTNDLSKNTQIRHSSKWSQLLSKDIFWLFYSFMRICENCLKFKKQQYSFFIAISLTACHHTCIRSVPIKFVSTQIIWSTHPKSFAGAHIKILKQKILRQLVSFTNSLFLNFLSLLSNKK
jgi:hypothetical protein